MRRHNCIRCGDIFCIMCKRFDNNTEWNELTEERKHLIAACCKGNVMKPEEDDQLYNELHKGKPCTMKK